MRVLVITASKYGATHEIGETVADELHRRGHDAAAVSADDHLATDIAANDAVVIGSAVYAGHWIESAKRLVEDHAEDLRARPVWLFSSGPVGDPPKPAEDPADAEPMIEATGAIEHRVFSGKLDRSKLRFADRAIAAALRAPEGDFRDFEAIREWAGQISEALRSEQK